MKRKSITIIFIALLVITILSTKAYAVDTFEVKIKESAKTVAQGETLTLSVSINNIDIENGLGTLGGTIEYDKTVFEEITSKSIKSNEDWESVTYNANNGKFVVLSASGETFKADTEVFTITLKVLDTAKVGSTTVKITDLSSSDGEKDYDTEDVKCNIEIEKSTVPEENNTVNNATTNNAVNNATTNNAVNNTTNNVVNNTTKNTTTNNVVNNTAKNTTNNTVTILPYAGESDIALVVGILAIASIIGYFKLKSYKEIK